MALTRRSFTVSALALATAPARAESPYPAKPITMLIPYPPGSGSDVVGRIGQLGDPSTEQPTETVEIQHATVASH